MLLSKATYKAPLHRIPCQKEPFWVEYPAQGLQGIYYLSAYMPNTVCLGIMKVQGCHLYFVSCTEYMRPILKQLFLWRLLLRVFCVCGLATFVDMFSFLHVHIRDCLYYFSRGVLWKEYLSWYDEIQGITLLWIAAVDKVCFKLAVGLSSPCAALFVLNVMQTVCCVCSSCCYFMSKQLLYFLSLTNSSAKEC